MHGAHNRKFAGETQKVVSGVIAGKESLLGGLVQQVLIALIRQHAQKRQ